MPGRLKSTKEYRFHANSFSRNPSLVGKEVVHSNKKIFVAGPKNSLTWKRDPVHIKASMNFFKMLREIKFKKVRIVPVKTDPVNQIQKYFHRPSIYAFEQFIQLKLGKIRSLPERVSKLDVVYCKALVKRFPRIKAESWEKRIKEAIKELKTKAKVGEYIDLGAEFEYFWRFDFRNFVVFDLTKEGIIKVGLIDV